MASHSNTASVLSKQVPATGNPLLAQLKGTSLNSPARGINHERPAPLEYKTVQLRAVQATLGLTPEQLNTFERLVAEAVQNGSEWSEDTLEMLVARLSPPGQHAFFRPQLQRVLGPYVRLVFKRLQNPQSPRFSLGIVPKSRSRESSVERPVLVTAPQIPLFPALRSSSPLLKPPALEDLRQKTLELADEISESKSALDDKKQELHTLETQRADDHALFALSQSLEQENLKLAQSIQALEAAHAPAIVDPLEELANKRMIAAIADERQRLTESAQHFRLSQNPFAEELDEKVAQYWQKRHRRVENEIRLSDHEIRLLSKDAELVKRSTVLKHETAALASAEKAQDGLFQYAIVVVLGLLLMRAVTLLFPLSRLT